jgi:hypothetical protein
MGWIRPADVLLYRMDNVHKTLFLLLQSLIENTAAQAYGLVR